ncbi:MAG: serine hydrolase [Halothece sp.]
MNKRIIIVTFLFLTSLITLRIVSLENHSQSSELEKQSRNAPPPDFNTEIGSALEKKQTELEQILKQYQEEITPESGAVVIDLDDQVKATSNEDHQFVAASLYKLFVAYAIYEKIEQGEISDEQKVPNSSFTVEACLQAMITVSDNKCGVELGNLVNWTQLDQKLENEGYTQTKLDNYDENGDLDGDKKTSAGDVAKLLSNLAQGKLLNPEHTDDFLANLKKQQRNDRLPQGLPRNADVAHKTGELEDYRHDAGIIREGEKQYIVVMLTAGWENPSQEAPPVFKEFSQALSTYFQHH